MKLNLRGFALAAGIVWGLVVFIVTLASVGRGAGQHVGLLSVIYLGYRVSFLGSIIGLVYGFVNGLLLGALFAWLYNQLAKEG